MKKKKKAKIHFHISMKMLEYFRGIIPLTKQNKTPLIPANPSKAVILPDGMLYSVNIINKTCRK